MKPPDTVPFAEYEKLRKEFANALAAIERLSMQIDKHATMMDDYKRAVSLAIPIVDVMCDMFRPEMEAPEDQPGPLLSDLEIKRPESLRMMTYGQLEIAAGALSWWEGR